MPARAWRATRDLAAVLGLLALAQLAVSLAAVGRLSPWLLGGQLALVVLLFGVAAFAHLRRRDFLRAGAG